MNSPLKIAARVEIDASQAPQGAAATAQAVASIGNEADRAATKLQRLINSSVGLTAGPANQNLREWSGALASQGKSIDELRAKYNPLFAVITQYKASLAEIRTLHAQQILSTNEMTAAIQRERQATLASIDAIKGRSAAIAGSRVANQNFQTGNVAFQLFDTVQTAPFMNPAMVGFQQGPQLAQSFAGMNMREAGSTLAAAAAQIVSPISLAAIGFTTAAAAAIHYGSAVFDSANKAEVALQKHEETLKRIRDLSNEAATGQSRYGQSVQGNIEFSANRDRYLLEKQLKSQLQTLPDAIGIDLSRVSSGANLLGSQPSDEFLTRQISSRYGVFTNAIVKFAKEAGDGRGDVKAFNDEVIRLANQDAGNKKLQELATFLLTATKEATDTAGAVRELNRLLEETTTISARRQASDAGVRFRADSEYQRLRLTRQYDADVAGLGARSPAEIEAATRRRLEAEQIDPTEDPDNRRLYIDQQARLARLQAEQQLKEAQEQRLRSVNSSVEAQQLELSLIEKTAGEAERLRTAYQLEAQLREEAARNNTKVDEAELALIREKAAELGRLAQLRASAGLLSDAQFDREQLGRNPLDRQIASQLKSAGLPVDLNSYEAGILRANEALREQVAAWEDIHDTGRSAIDDIIGSATEGFEDIDDVLKNIGKDVAKQILTLGAGNPIKNALYGDNLPTISSVGGIGGFFGSLFGGKNPASGGATGAMTVTAGTVMVNGGVSSALTSFNPAANSNANPLASFDLGQTNKGGVAGQVWNFFAGKGLKPHQIAGIMGNVGAESAFNPLAVGDSGNAFGLFQHNDRSANLFTAIGGRGNLGNVQGQLDFAWKELLTSESGALKRLLASTDVKSATAAFAGFERPQGWSLANPEAAHNFIGRLNGANEALSKFGGSTSIAADGLGTLGSGFSTFGTALSKIPAGGGGGGGGGLFGWLSNLFGGSSLNLALSASPQFASAWAAGGIGLYDRGGYTGPGGVLEPRGVVHAGEIVWSQRDIARAGGVATVEAMRLGRRGYADGGYAGTGAAIYEGARRENEGRSGSAGRNAPIIHNYSGQNVEYEETTDQRGNRQPVVTVGEMSAAAVKQRGNPLRRAVQSEFGVKPRRNAR